MEIVGYIVVGVVALLIIVGGVSKGVEDQKQRAFNRAERERIAAERGT